MSFLLLSVFLLLPSSVSGAPSNKLMQSAVDSMDGARATDAESLQHESTQSMIDRGRYMILVGGCNDCHTPGFSENGGQLPEPEWLSGIPVGFAGPWGTTYPVNLRLYFDTLSESEWRVRARTPMRPPMPSPSLMSMTDEDLDAIYAYVRHLGPSGVPAPEFVPPGEAIRTPYFDFVPRNP